MTTTIALYVCLPLELSGAPSVWWTTTCDRLPSALKGPGLAFHPRSAGRHLSESEAGLIWEKVRVLDNSDFGGSARALIGARDFAELSIGGYRSRRSF